MLKRLMILTILFLLIFQISGFAKVSEPFLQTPAMIVAFTAKQEIPQAPRVSPDGAKFMYELYSNRKCEIWICDVDGKNKQSLTQDLQMAGKIGMKVENAFWHPSQQYVALNEMPTGNQRKGVVYIASFHDNKITEFIKIDQGARPQFSKPNGNVLFYEATVEEPEDYYGSVTVNTIKYRVLGSNPLNPINISSIELRGPIQEVIYNLELSHPSLAPDGTTILFAARTSTTNGSDILQSFNITDGNRQKAVALWKEIVVKKSNTNFLQKELNSCLKSDELSLNLTTVRETTVIQNLIKNIDKLGNQPTIIKGFTRKDFVICWLMRLLTKLDLKYEAEIQKNVYSRIWMTDVFGAPIVPLVDDKSNVPLPQKWATVSKSGRFAVFEAGYYQNRHLYFVNLKTRKALKLTNVGTYNSSPEISPDEQWIYFESNRSGARDIWRAQLQLEQLLNETK